MVNEVKTKTVEEIRREIDGIDSKLVELLKQRLNSAVDMALAKEQSGLPIYDNGREEEVIRRNCRGEYSVHLKNVYDSIMAESKKVQDRLWQY